MKVLAVELSQSKGGQIDIEFPCAFVEPFRLQDLKPILRFDRH
ncbi:MAG: hypothetical protein K0S02_1662 [Achromobacter mucicolens]|nr:hypothetical protein [Achromobacter mucicolens]